MQDHIVYLPLKIKPRTRAMLPHHTDQVIHDFTVGEGPKKLFSHKGIQTLDLMRIITKFQGLYHLSQHLGINTKINYSSQTLKYTANMQK